MPPIFDDKDYAIKTHRLVFWDSVGGPRVGDFLELEDGTLHRFTHAWDETLRTTSALYPGHGSFYFGPGFCSYSGGLDPGVTRTRLQDTGRIKEGCVWFFHHDYACAHNAVTTTIPCRVYRVMPGNPPAPRA